MKHLRFTLAVLASVAITQASYAQTYGTSGPWDLNGNYSTDPKKNYIGTGDYNDFVFKTNNTEVYRLTTKQGMEFNSWYDPSVYSYQHPPLVTGTGNEIRGVDINGTGSDGGLLRLTAGGGTNANTKSYIDLTGDYGSGADMDRNIVLGTAGTERMRIDNTGYVGIGTATPAFALDVNGDINVPSNKVYRLNGQQVLSVTSASGNLNFFAGANAGINNITGSLNTYVGNGSGISNTSGIYNTFVGASGGSSGSYNTSIGGATSGGSGDYNTITGYYAGAHNTTGSYNTFNGIMSGRNNSTGTNNTYLGMTAGLTNTTGSNNTCVGSAADVTTAGLSNAAAIGYNAKVATSNSMVLGDNTINVGIGTSSPGEKLDVTGGIRMGTTTSTNPGTIRFNGTDFEGYAGGFWRSLTGALSGNWGVNGTSIYNLNTGNVGVGTNVPSEKLEVTGGIRLGTSASTNTGTIRYTGTDFEGYTGGSWKSLTGVGLSKWGTSGANIYSLNAGNVGVGTTTPAYKLEIVSGDLNINFGLLRLNTMRALSNTGYQNIFVGENAGIVTTGSENTFSGYSSGIVHTTGFGNTALGAFSADRLTTGIQNVCIGLSSGSGTAPTNGLISGGANVMIGNNAGKYCGPSSSNNTYLGGSAGNSRDGNLNTYVGSQSIGAAGLGSGNSALGAGSGTGANVDYSSAIGYQSLANSSYTIALGGTGAIGGAGYATTVVINKTTRTATRSYRLEVDGESYFNGGILLGNSASTDNGTIRYSGTDIEGYVGGAWKSLTAVGNWGNSGSNIYSLNAGNVGIGTSSPGYKLDVNGDINIATGKVIRVNGSKAFSLTDAQLATVSVGKDAGLNSTGLANIFMGLEAGKNNTGTDNYFFGYQSGSNATGARNVFMGTFAGQNHTSGDENVFIGMLAGNSNTTASYNTILGAYAGRFTTGSANTFIGRNAGNANTTGQYNTYLGANTGGSATLTNAAAIGYGASVTTSNTMVLGGSTTGSYPTVVIGNATKSASGYLLEVYGTTYCNSGLWTASDKNFKKNINDYTHAMDVINKLRPVSYQFRDDIYFDKTSDEAAPVKRNFPAEQQIGFIAQELETVLPNMVRTDDKGYKAVNYDQLFGVLVQGIKEQDQKLTALTADNDNLKQQNATLQGTLEQLNARLSALENKSGNTDKGMNTTFSSSTTDKAYLEQNSPNPFSENTVIKYYIPAQSGKANIVIRSDRALEVLNFNIDHKGFGNIIVSGNSLTVGAYFCELYVDGNLIDTKKMLLIK